MQRPDDSRHLDLIAHPHLLDEPELPPSKAKHSRMAAINAYKFEWAAEWVKKNGMTLPPDTPELRSLRNWFCFKLNQYKKGTLGPKNIELLEQHGLDFAKYEALNTGKGERVPDAVLIDELRRWHAQTGSYDLSPSAPESLHRHRTLITEAFVARGRTERARKIEEALPGFSIPLWRLHGQPAPTKDELDWWAEAAQFEDATVNTPAYLGTLHPQTDPHCAEWAKKQLSRVKTLKAAQRGFLVGVGLIVDKVQRQVSQRREVDRAVRNQRSLEEPTYAAKDRRLNTFLGACMYVRMKKVGSSDKEMMAAFGITPVALLALRENVDELIPKLTFDRITEMRQLYLDIDGMPEKMDESVGARLFNDLRSMRFVLVAIQALGLKQDIALY